MFVRIDAHHHVWDLAVRDQPWSASLPQLRRSFGMDELRPSLAEHGIDATILVQTVPVAEETPELLQLAYVDPTVAGVVGWIDLSAPEAIDRLAELSALSGNLVGIRHGVQDEPDPRWLCRSQVRRGLAAVGAAGLSFDLLIRPAQLGAAIETVRALPELRFVLDHAAKPLIAQGILEPWREQVSHLAALPNVAAKLSGLVTEVGPNWTVEMLSPYTDVLLDSFGPQRIMFGSDWPVCLLAGTYGEVVEVSAELTAKLLPDETADVFGGTATRWYGLT
jgi:L-fuconolactonase